MNQIFAFVASGLALLLALSGEPAHAQGSATLPGAAGEAPFASVLGRWMRPDGGYVINIRSVDARGRLQADYANPNPLPFAKAEATRDGKIIRLFFELRAGGYNGSTYTLTYDPASDSLKGVYYQAVAQQKFDVYFMRAR